MVAAAALGFSSVVRRRRRLVIALTLAVEAVALIAIVGVGLRFFPDWVNLDVEVYMEAGRRFAAGEPLYGWSVPGGYTFRYSPPFAALMAPWSALPLEVASVALRALGLLALAWSVRGLGWVVPVVLLSPGVVFDQVPGNVMTIGVAAMIAVIRWPNVRTITLYGLLVLLAPKPAFLPVLLWGITRVPRAAAPVAVLGGFGLALLAFHPGFGDGLLRAGSEWGRTLVPGLVLPASLVAGVLVLAIGLTIAALRRWRLLGPAAVLASPYFYGYASHRSSSSRCRTSDRTLVVVGEGSSPERRRTGRGASPCAPGSGAPSPGHQRRT